MILIASPSPLEEAEKRVLRAAVARRALQDKVQLSSQATSAHEGPVVRLGTSVPPIQTSWTDAVTCSPREMVTRPDAMTQLDRALRKAAASLELGGPLPSPRNSARCAESRSSTLDQIRGWQTSKVKTVYLDLETQGDIKKLHHSQRRLLSLALHTPEAGETLLIDEELLDGPWPELIEALQFFDLAAHNGKFDLATLCIMLSCEPDTLKLAYDTLLMHYVKYPAASTHRLKDLLYQYLGIEDWGFPDSQMANLAAVDRRQLWRYNALDAINGAQLLEILLGELWTAAEKKSLRVRMAASELLQWMEPKGIGFDADYTRTELHEVLTTRADQLRIECVAMAHTVLGSTRIVYKQRSRTVKDPETGEKQRTVWKEPVEQPYEFNPGSHQQVKALYAKAGKPLSGTAKEVLEPRAVKGDVFAETLLKWRRTAKQLDAFVDPLLEKCSTVLGPTLLFPSYKIHGTKSSRLSAEGPNIHQIPRDPAIRRAFPARAPDRRVVEVDYGQGELRVIAAEANDSWLLELFHNPAVDIFTQMLPVIFPGINVSALSTQEKKELRAKLKGVVYGLNFGRGAMAIAHEIGSTAVEAKRIIDTFFANASAVALWRQNVMRQAKKGLPLVTRFGSRFHFEVVTAENLKAVERSALSHLPQGNLSDMNLLSAVQTRTYIKDSGRDWYIAALVHDACILDVPEADAEEAAEVVSGFMTGIAKRVYPEVPFTVDAKFGQNWADTA